MKTKLIFLATAFLCLKMLATAQTINESDYSIIKTADNINIKYTRSAQPFNMSVTGKEMTEAQGEEGTISMQGDHGEKLSVRFFKTKDFIDASKKLTGAEILLTHREWQAWMQAARMNGRIFVNEGSMETITIPDLRTHATVTETLNVPALSWVLGRDGKNERTHYRTALLGKVIVMVGATVGNENEIAQARALTKQTLESLALLPAPMPKKNSRHP